MPPWVGPEEGIRRWILGKGSDERGGGELGLKKRNGMDWGGTKVARSCEGCVAGGVLEENMSEGEGNWEAVIVEIPFGGLKIVVPGALLRAETGSLELDADGGSLFAMNAAEGGGAGRGLKDCGDCDGVGGRVLGAV